MADVGYIKAEYRVRKALMRAKEEFPILAAPDGTVSVSIVDLAAVLERMSVMRDTLAMGKSQWQERWYGSPPQRGSSIVTEDGALVAWLGGDEDTHTEVGKIVATHNAALAELRKPA